MTAVVWQRLQVRVGMTGEKAERLHRLMLLTGNRASMRPAVPSRMQQGSRAGGADWQLLPIGVRQPRCAGQPLLGLACHDRRCLLRSDSFRRSGALRRAAALRRCSGRSTRRSTLSMRSAGCRCRGAAAHGPVWWRGTHQAGAAADICRTAPLANRHSAESSFAAAPTCVLWQGSSMGSRRSASPPHCTPPGTLGAGLLACVHQAVRQDREHTRGARWREVR